MGRGVTFHLLCSDRTAHCWQSLKDRNTNSHVDVVVAVRTWGVNTCERVSNDNGPWLQTETAASVNGLSPHTAII